jgi:hypothetical protein
MGNFLVDAVHENRSVQSISAHPILDGVVGERMPLLGVDELPEVVKQINEILSEE